MKDEEPKRLTAQEAREIVLNKQSQQLNLLYNCIKEQAEKGLLYLNWSHELTDYQILSLEKNGFIIVDIKRKSDTDEFYHTIQW